jgi:hypothetical protein
MEVILEFLLTLLFELFFEVGSRNFANAFELSKDHNRYAAFFGYIMLAIFGALFSLTIFPHHLIRPPALQILNVCLTPILSGTLMSFVGKRLRAKEARVIKLDSFFYGWLFAFVFALIRLIYAK